MGGGDFFRRKKYYLPLTRGAKRDNNGGVVRWDALPQRTLTCAFNP